jgi:hypothetical protein
VKLKEKILELLSFLIFIKFINIISINLIKLFNFQIKGDSFFNKFFYKALLIHYKKNFNKESYRFINEKLYFIKGKKFSDLVKKKYLLCMGDVGKLYDDLNTFKLNNYDINKLDYKGLPFKEVFKCYNYLKKIEKDNSANQIVLAQLGSASGHDLIWTLKNTNIRNFISSDISQSALDFQKKDIFNQDLFNKVKSLKVEFVKQSCTELSGYFTNPKFQENIKVILGKGSLQYETPENIIIFFTNISKTKNLYLSISQPLDNNFLKFSSNDFFSSYRGHFSFNHNYKALSEKFGMRIIDYGFTELGGITNINLLAKSE